MPNSPEELQIRNGDSDTFEERERIYAQRRVYRSRRRRTVVQSVFAAGLVAMLIGFGNDVSQRNNAVDNCVDNQKIASALVSVAQDVVDESPDKAVVERWSGYRAEFDAELPVPANVIEDHREEYQGDPCTAQFPKPKLFGIIPWPF